MEQILSFVLLGKKGAGKSASGNTILGRQAFISNKSSKSVKPDVVEESGMVDGQQVTIYDTPGFCDPEMRENDIQQMINEKVFQKCESGVCVFLLVIEADSFTADETETVKRIEKLLGKNRLNQTWILITGGDKLNKENKTIKEFLDENKSLKELIQKYSQRYHVFDNENQRSTDQVRLLLTKIIQKSLGLKASDGGRLLRQIPNNRANTEDEQRTADGGLSRVRIVLLGKTGAGKSAAGNTILRQEAFVSKMKYVSVTETCLEKTNTVSGREVSVVDTPGFFDTNVKDDALMTEISRTVYLSSPGPHTFLIVLRAIDRFTDQEKQIYDLIEIMFGEEVSKYAIVLLTRGDEIKGESTETLINENCALRQIVQECGGRYHVFENKEKDNANQVSDLLQKIDTMIEQNGGHYSNEMFEDAQRLRQEEQKRKQREEEEIQAKTLELEEMKAEMKREKEKRKQREEVAERAKQERTEREQELKAEAEEIERMIRKLQTPRDDAFTQLSRKYKHRFSLAAFALDKVCLGIFVASCAILGGAVGCIGGPAGAAAGVSVGAAGAAAVGEAVGEAVAAVGEAAAAVGEAVIAGGAALLKSVFRL